MVDNGPAPSELGINVEHAPKATLPLPPDSRLVRKETISSQEIFSRKVKDIVLVPVRAELQNGNLANFLTQLNEQRGLNEDKIGIVLFLNQKKSDAPEISEENRFTTKFLSLLIAKDSEGIAELDIPEKYKELAQSIIEKNRLEIRFDYADSTPNFRTPRFGLLRRHLFSLANAFRNPSISDQEITIHLSDIDTYYAPNHFAQLKNFYADNSHTANISEEDFVLGIHEKTPEDDITRDLLATLDQFRLFKYYTHAAEMLRGRLRSGTPMISGKFSYFFDQGQLKPQFVEALGSGVNEDFYLGNAMRRESGTSLGNIGEVYRLHRARTHSKPDSYYDDGQEAYLVTQKIINKEPISDVHFFNDGDGDTLLATLDKYVAEATDGTEVFKQSDEYKQILDSELKEEEAKVRLRRIRLFDYIDSLSGKRTLTKTEQTILDPYLQYFDDESTNIQQMLSGGQSPEQIGVHYLQKYDSFFNFNHQLHTQIARIRAIKHYAFAQNLIRPSSPNAPVDNKPIPPLSTLKDFQPDPPVE